MASIDRINRLLRLIELLQSGRSYNTKQLADLCNVSRRTVFRDLSTLQDSGIAVLFDERQQGYAIRSALYLPPSEVTVEEALAIVVLAEGLGDSQCGIPFYRPAHSAALKLLSCLPRQMRKFVGELSQSISVRLDAHNPLPGSQRVYDLLLQAVNEHHQIRIRYTSHSEEKDFSTLLSPYRMLFVRRSWYVIGRSSLHRAVRTFNVGRIQDPELVKSRFVVPQRFSLDRYLGNAWSLIRDRKNRHKVIVRFHPKVAHNVAEVQWHKTQKIVWNKDGTLDFHVTVDGLGEIVWWVLGYGREAEVLQPKKLREMICGHVEDMHKLCEPQTKRPKRARKKTAKKTARKTATKTTRKKKT